MASKDDPGLEEIGDYDLEDLTYPDDLSTNNDDIRLEICDPIEPPGFHVVVQGESLWTIAATYNHYGDAIWKHAENEELRASRDPELLCPGDKIYIPERSEKLVTISTGKLHRFVYERPETWLRIVLQDEDGNPRSDLDFELQLEELPEPITGTTKKDGLIEAQVSRDAKKAVLTLSDELVDEEYELFINHLDPCSVTSGFQGRLDNLGYRCNAADAENEHLKSTVRLYQIDKGIDPTGEMDAQTRSSLDKDYGSG